MNDHQPAPSEADAGAVDYAAKKRRIILMLLAYSAILGVMSVFLPAEGSQLDFIAGLPLLILGISWCFADANERNHRIGGLMKLTLVLFFIIGFLLYILQTRGIRGFKTLALAVLLVGIMVACLVSTGLATVFAGHALEILEFEESTGEVRARFWSR